jgi:iron complex outermembrane receptor protein
LAATTSPRVHLSDQIGTSLNGSHNFSRFNPVAGATYKIAPGSYRLRHVRRGGWADILTNPRAPGLAPPLAVFLGLRVRL